MKDNIWFITFRNKPTTIGEVLVVEERQKLSYRPCELDSHICARTRERVCELYTFYSGKSWYDRHIEIGLKKVAASKLEMV